MPHAILVSIKLYVLDWACVCVCVCGTLAVFLELSNEEQCVYGKLFQIKGKKLLLRLLIFRLANCETYGEITLNAPVLTRSPKLSSDEPFQYLDR